MEPFTDDEFIGTRKYDQDLIELLKTANGITGPELQDRLGLDPGNSEHMQALDAQLQQLETYGLVESTPHGWRWTG